MTDHSSLDHLHQNLLSKGALFASYRLPEKPDTYTVIQLRKKNKSFQPDLLNKESGFLFSPFNTMTEKPVWIQADTLYKNGEFILGNEQWQEYKITRRHIKFPEPECINRVDYIDKIQKLITEIKKGRPQKAVFSRVFKTSLNDWSKTDLFNALIKNYPNAFVYLVNLPGGISWVGASPETLLAVTSHELTTMALAGTRKKTDGNAAWGEKEVKEQKFVEQHIENVFENLGLGFTKVGPDTYNTGSDIEHLRTLYFSNNHNNNIWGLLEKLHPTPAVCGFPVDLSRKWLEENEGYNRSFYSGYLGPVNLNDSSSFYVNLRCARINEKQAHIFVGGGITESSDPQREWEETELKSRTLLNIIESKPKI